MKIAIAGASGLIGKALIPFLESAGHEVFLLKRGETDRSVQIAYDPEKEWIDIQKMEGIEAVINLAGESIMGRWSESKKKRILDSRVKTTSLISRSLASLKQRPKLLINASAVGYYGNRGDMALNETTPKGTGFLSDVADVWEKSAHSAEGAGIRVVYVRFGVVLSTQGGALKQMLTPFKLGLGGRLGDGQQYMSWIAIDDVLGAIYHILNRDEIRGAVNVVAPHPVRNCEFTTALGRILNRPTPFPIPAFIIKLLLGQMGVELLLASTKALPKRLQETGYPFLYPTIEQALLKLLEN